MLNVFDPSWEIIDVFLPSPPPAGNKMNTRNEPLTILVDVRNSYGYPLFFVESIHLSFLGENKIFIKS